MSSEYTVEPYDVFDVDSSGRILQADFNDDLTRADCYNLSLSWLDTPGALIQEMDNVHPLACAVHAIYSDASEALTLSSTFHIRGEFIRITGPVLLI